MANLNSSALLSERLLSGLSSDFPALGVFNGQELLDQYEIVNMTRERPFSDVRGAAAVWHTEDAFFPLPNKGPHDPMWLGGASRENINPTIYLGYYSEPTADKPVLMMGEHEVEDNDSVVSTERVGPFITTGSFDWTSFYWTDAFGLEAKLKRGERQFLLAHVSAAVDSAGDIIPYPPLHIHHVHVGPVLFGGISPWTPMANWHVDDSTYIEHHGDFQCRSGEVENDGTRCNGETYAEPKELLDPISVSAQINDVRADHSPPLTWYYEITLKMLKPSEEPPLRTRALQYLLTTPGGGAFGTFMVSCMYDMFQYTTGRWIVGGEALGVKVHSHQFGLQEFYLTNAEPHELGYGLGQLRWNADDPEEMPKYVTALGYPSGIELREAILANLVESRGSEEAASEAILCHADGDQEEIDGRLYDRMSPVTCRPFRWAQGDRFTTAAFFGPSYEFGPNCDNMGRFRSMPPGQDLLLPQHATWWVEYMADDSLSYYTSTPYAHDPEAVYGLNSRVTDLFIGCVTLSEKYGLSAVIGHCTLALPNDGGYDVRLFLIDAALMFFDQLLVSYNLLKLTLALILLVVLHTGLVWVLPCSFTCSLLATRALKGIAGLAIPTIMVNAVIITTLVDTLTIRESASPQTRLPDLGPWAPVPPTHFVASGFAVLIAFDLLVVGTLYWVYACRRPEEGHPATLSERSPLQPKIERGGWC